MTKYFKQISTGLILKADRKELVEQYEKHKEHYTPCDEPSKNKPKGTTVAPKGDQKPKAGNSTPTGANALPAAPSGATGGDGK